MRRCHPLKSCNLISRSDEPDLKLFTIRPDHSENVTASPVPIRVPQLNADMVTSLTFALITALAPMDAASVLSLSTTISGVGLGWRAVVLFTVTLRSDIFLYGRSVMSPDVTMTVSGETDAVAAAGRLRLTFDVSQVVQLASIRVALPIKSIFLIMTNDSFSR